MPSSGTSGEVRAVPKPSVLASLSPNLLMPSAPASTAVAAPRSKLAEEAEYDPQSEAITAAYTAAFNDYYHRELKFGSDKTYKVSAGVFRDWDFKHRLSSSRFPLPMANTGPDLAEALGLNPHLHVLVLNGLYDLATPFAGAEYDLGHMSLGPGELQNIRYTYYPAGHMMYIDPASARQLKADLAAFYAETQ